jgi:predicted dehydrogenase
MEKKKVRIGFIGVGGMGQMAHLKNYINVEDCEVVALAELKETQGKLVAARYGIPNVYTDHREMIKKEGLDGVVASQPFYFHAVLLPEVYPYVKNVFTEKPLCISVAAGEGLVKKANEAGCTHMVGYHKRSDPAVMYAKKQIDEYKKSKKLGALKYVRIVMPSGDWIANGFSGLIKGNDKYPEIRGEEKEKGMDEKTYKAYVDFVNYYIHQVNLMRHLLGESYKVSFADKSGVLMAVESVSGIAGTIEMTPYRTTIEWEESALVAFEKGYLKIKLPAPLASNRPGSVEVYEDEGDGKTPIRMSPTLPWLHAMWQQAINFVKVCKGEMKPLCEASEAVEDLKVAREYIRMRG